MKCVGSLLREFDNVPRQIEYLVVRDGEGLLPIN